MNTAEPRQFQFPADFETAMALARALNLDGLEFHSFTETVLAYSISERVPVDFPRPDEHVVIADYIIDLPVVAVDASPASEHYGRVLGYCGGDFWVVADSPSEFAARFQQHQQSALYGR